MTKEEAIKKLSDIKVYVEGKSEEIQKKLFELGFLWASRTDEVLYSDKPFLFTNNGKIITSSNSMDFFSNDEREEIKADDILSITIDKECPFKIFDKILVRDSDNHIWKGTFISYIIKKRYWRLAYKYNKWLLGSNHSL